MERSILNQPTPETQAALFFRRVLTDNSPPVAVKFAAQRLANVEGLKPQKPRTDMYGGVD